jgi:coenzyme F420-reducing hydrogenase beta subunit
MIRICDETKCTGCGMCSNICTHNAIKMIEDKHGFMHPCVDTSKCVECGLCKNKCPANGVEQVGKNVLKVYAAWNKCKKDRKIASSGGMFSILAKEVISLGGVVVGVKWDDNLKPVHCMIDCIDDLPRLYKSKYVQSDTNNIFQRVQEKLNQGIVVLFSGTPCQNAALNNFLSQGYDNLIQVDIVCHGVPSYESFKRYISELNDKYNRHIIKFNFRLKKPYQDYFYIGITLEDQTFNYHLAVNDPFFQLFNVGYLLRESCHNCQYTNIRRCSDITLGDFWGFLPHNFKMIDYNKGVSLILINSIKGNELFEKIKKKCKYEDGNLDLAVMGNRTLREPYNIEQDKLQQFWNDYEEGLTTEKLRKKYIPNPSSRPKYMWFSLLKKKFRWVFKQ